MHSIEYGYAPTSFYIDPMFQKNLNIENHYYPLRNLGNYYIPRVKNNSLNKFPLYSFPVSWNNLNDSLSSIANKNSFKYELKTHLLSRLMNFECNKLFCFTCSYIVN